MVPPTWWLYGTSLRGSSSSLATAKEAHGAHVPEAASTLNG